MNKVWRHAGRPHKTAVAAGVICFGQHGVSEFSKDFAVTSGSGHATISPCESDGIELSGKPVRIHIWIKVPVTDSRLKAHAVDAGMVSFAEPPIPSFHPGFLAMTSDVLGDVEGCAVFSRDYGVAIRVGSDAFVPINSKWVKLSFASANTGSGKVLFLSFGNAHKNLTDENENRVNCWNPLTALQTTTYAGNGDRDGLKTCKDWAISIEASGEPDERSTTRAWSPERMVRPLERTTRKGRYSLNLCESMRDINTESPYTKKLDDLSQHDVETVIDKVLKIDATEAFDDAAYAQFNATPLRVAPTGGNSATAVTLSTGGSTTITNDEAMSKAHVGAIVDEMKERNIPAYFDSGDYGVIARPKTFRTIKTALESVHQYVDAGFDMIMNGEIGRYEGVRFFEQTQVASEGWSNFATQQTDGAFFFGGDTVHEAVVCSEEIRGKIPLDFGRDRGIAWFYLGGFKLVHAAAANARIMKWDSAA